MSLGISLIFQQKWVQRFSENGGWLTQGIHQSRSHSLRTEEEEWKKEKVDRGEWEALQSPDREDVIEEERSNNTEQTMHGQRSTEWKT